MLITAAGGLGTTVVVGRPDTHAVGVASGALRRARR
jgi:hypothetical protein